MILLYDTAIRIAELLELKIASLKLKSVPSIHIHGKGDKERSVSITDATVSHLKKYLRQFHPEMLPDQPLILYENQRKYCSNVPWKCLKNHQ